VFYYVYFSPLSFLHSLLPASCGAFSDSTDIRFGVVASSLQANLATVMHTSASPLSRLQLAHPDPNIFL
jgi:hypothetical protein